MRDDKEVMENPYLQSPDLQCGGLFWAAGHSPNHAALATRKTCQNDEFPDSFAPLTTLQASHISPRRSSGYRAILLALLAVEPLIAQLPLMTRTLPGPGPSFLARHDELMGDRGPLYMAETPN
jgi:hypothetical protein